MTELYFRLGDRAGFTSSKLADKKEGYANPIRELLQNSLDAAREAGNECSVDVYVETIAKKDVPEIATYEKVLRKAVHTQSELGGYNANSQRVVEFIQDALAKPEIPVLMFVDNGIGMPPDRIEGILSDISIKGDEKAGGSYGVGHLSSYSLSPLRYVLYATKYKDKHGNVRRLFTGQPILAGYNDDDNSQRGNSGRIVKQFPKSEKNPKFDYTDEFPEFIERKMADIATGTMVVVLGLNEGWSEDAEYAMASNFFHAIAHESLRINIHLNGRTKSIDDHLGALIESRKDGRRARGSDTILSGKMVYQAWRTIMDSGNQKDIALSNGEKVHVHVATNPEYDSAIVLVRNGMLIARHDSMLSHRINGLRKQPDYEPFTAVIDIDQDHAPKLFALVKGAEGPHHNRLVKRLKPAEQDNLQKLLNELSNEIAKHLAKAERETFDLPLFEIEKATEGSSSGRRPSGQHKKAKARPKTGRLKRKKSGRKDDKSRNKPDINLRDLVSNSAVRYDDDGDKFTVYMRLIPSGQINQRGETQEIGAKDETYLSFFVGEDSDKDESSLYLDFISVTLDGVAIDIPKDRKSQVKLGRLQPGRTYNVIAEIEKKPVSGMQVALSPVLGLKQPQKEGTNQPSKEAGA